MEKKRLEHQSSFAGLTSEAVRASVFRADAAWELLTTQPSHPPTAPFPKYKTARVNHARGGADAARPLAAWAQQPLLTIVGLRPTVHEGNPPPALGSHSAKPENEKPGNHRGPRKVMVRYHWLEGQYDRLPALLAELGRPRPSYRHRRDLLVKSGSKATTQTNRRVLGRQRSVKPRPLVFIASFKPHRAGNVTGIVSDKVLRAEEA